MNPSNKNAPDVVAATYRGLSLPSSQGKELDVSNLRRTDRLRNPNREKAQPPDGRRLSYSERFVHRQIPLRPIETARLFATLADLKVGD